MNRATQMLRATGPPGARSSPKPGDNGQLRQEPSRRRPDHNDPLNGDHHGFDDSDSACRDGKPRGGIVLLAT